MEIDVSSLPKPPEGSQFRLAGVIQRSTPHPYCITPRHLDDSGILDAAAIERAERKGAHCGVDGCSLSYDKHISESVLKVVVKQNRDLNGIEGLNAYLVNIKDAATALGIMGFVFPTEDQRNRNRQK